MMSISWIAPGALVGLGLIALPIAVHLLVRQPARQVPFPSLRFLYETQLAALRRRTIQDGALLCCRIAIVALAALALAGPVVRTDSRMAAFASRTSRAIVALDGADDPVVERAAQGSWRSATFRRTDVVNALGDAIRWLNEQPPASREIVVAGALRRGSIRDADLALIPADIGVRFEPVAFESETQTQMAVLTRRDGVIGRADRVMTLTADTTQVIESRFTPLSGELIAIEANPANRDLANAALRAVLDAGIPWSDFSTPVVIVWQGGTDPARAGARVIRMPVPSPVSATADAVMAAIVGATPRPDLREPLAISPEQLRAWTRAPGPMSPEAPLSDEGDRRWLWAAALIALACEWWLRRSRTAATAVAGEEARVA